ncbi:cobyrinic acid a,c-diamide synthase [Qaidamihabitans albus]|uniref:cobyrinic acid a,c-diamide synthase n=1 Tax=Qaidamihabitans albus TaxID=2795733 RepID=UPI0027DAC9AB|nr:cobyrinic acid a,c-diamide synthase [Qaidamihabitans albus]
MSRRASLPGASELFRRTSSPALGQPSTAGSAGTGATGGNGDGGRSYGNGRADDHDRGHGGSGDRGGSNDGSDGGDRGEGGGSRAERQLARTSTARRGSGRKKHDAKITVYVSGDELLAMEHARLALRGTHDLVVDRGRIVREAVAVLLADFDQHGEDSVLVQRLRNGELDSEEARG